VSTKRAQKQQMVTVRIYVAGQLVEVAEVSGPLSVYGKGSK
jgi:hypothetical protein